jgi:alpha-L-arabinofuranosidase
MQVLERFVEGEAVPEWIMTVSPLAPDSEMPRSMVFGADVEVAVDDADELHIRRIGQWGNVEAIVSVDGGLNVSLAAGTRTVHLHEQDGAWIGTLYADGRGETTYIAGTG